MSWRKDTPPTGHAVGHERRRQSMELGKEVGERVVPAGYNMTCVFFTNSTDHELILIQHMKDSVAVRISLRRVLFSLEMRTETNSFREMYKSFTSTPAITEMHNHPLIYQQRIGLHRPFKFE
jgi:hypothetical protein